MKYIKQKVRVHLSPESKFKCSLANLFKKLLDFDINTITQI